MEELREIRIKCPETNLTRKERIANLLNQLETWINSPNLNQLLEEFGFNASNNLNFANKVKLMNDFVNEHWDFRKNKGERWNMTNDTFSEKQKELIIATAKELGLYSSTNPLSGFNYVLPLGGAGRSNIDRPILSKKVIDYLNLNKCRVVALSGKRQLSEEELNHLPEFAKGADTEFEMLTQGVLDVFNLDNSKFKSKVEDNDNQNLSWEIREYDKKYKNCSIFSLAAPSTDPTRRANSRDTFKFFLEKFDISNKDKVLLVTTNIYVPYQLLAFIDLAIDRGFYVDCIGCPPQDHLANYSNYLQEIKATVNQINRLVEKYSEDK